MVSIEGRNLSPLSKWGYLANTKCKLRSHKRCLPVWEQRHRYSNRSCECGRHRFGHIKRARKKNKIKAILFNRNKANIFLRNQPGARRNVVNRVKATNWVLSSWNIFITFMNIALYKLCGLPNGGFFFWRPYLYIVFLKILPPTYFPFCIQNRNNKWAIKRCRLRSALSQTWKQTEIDTCFIVKT